MAEIGDRDPESFDVVTLEGIGEFARYVQELAQRHIFALGGLPTFGVVFGSRDFEGRDRGSVQAHMLINTGIPHNLIKKALRAACLRAHAEGTMLISVEEGQLVIQMEHRRLGDLVWYSSIGKDRFMGKLIGPNTLEKFEIKRLSCLPERYMS